MIRFFAALVFALSFGVVETKAQTAQVYVQIEAQPSLEEAQQAIRIYASSLQDVNGFSLGNGYYAIALGPYPAGDATQVLRVLRSEGRIPQDSYIAQQSWFASQFYPVAGAQSDTQSDTPMGAQVQAQAPAQDSAPLAQSQPESPPQYASNLPDETPDEARRSEARLSREERDQLQIALKWAGFYNGAIDGAFGPGTRNSMGAWQGANGYDVSGILTTQQRADLVGQYNQVLNDLGLSTVTDQTAGIAMKMPMNAVAFDHYEAPFAFYEPTGDLGARVILISEPGTQDTLNGLYEIMQTLAVVPEDGPRARKGNGFTIEGSNSRVISYTEASVVDGQIKGFTLVWPLGDEDRRTRLLAEMRASFTRTPGVMQMSQGADTDQRVDLVSGLKLRKPKLSRSGVFVSADGAVLTVAEAVQSCGRITVAEDYDAQVVQIDQASGLAVLRPVKSIAPRGVATFAQSTPRLQSEIAVAGYSYEGILGAPSLSFGTLQDTRGLGGNERVDRLEVATLPGDAGGPVLDDTGAVIGILHPRNSDDRKLPNGVAFAADGQSVAAMLSTAGLSARPSVATQTLTPEALTRQANAMTVLVSCWN